MLNTWKSKPRQMSIHGIICIYSLLACWLQESTQQIVIKELKVPPLVKAGEDEYIVLDCIYDLRNTSTDGLVVKWFFNEDNLEYQWIYGNLPMTDPSATHIDVGYKVTDDPTTMYRAIKLINPNINQTGNYKCNVFSYDDDRSADATMIVYSAEETFDLKYRKKLLDGEEGLEVTCAAEGLYPQPTLEISINDAILNQTEKPDITMRDDGRYDIMIRLSISEEDLPSVALIECELEIPKANYTSSRIIELSSGPPTSTPSVTTNMLRKMEIQAINNSQQNNDNGGDGTIPTLSTSLVLTAILVLFNDVLQ